MRRHRTTFGGGASPQGVAFQMPKPSQTDIVQTGDTADRFASGWYDIVQPEYPKVYAQLDSSATYGDCVMKDPLIVGGVSNTLRFVGVNGTQSFGVGNNINAGVIDKLSGLMYLRINSPQYASWSAAISGALTYSITINGVVYNDWHVASRSELEQFIGSTGIIDPNTLAEILAISNATQWTSDTVNVSPTNAFYYDMSNFNIFPLAKSTPSQRAIFVRKAHNLITAP